MKHFKPLLLIMSICAASCSTQEFSLTSGDQTITVSTTEKGLDIVSLTLGDKEFVCPSEFKMPDGLSLSYEGFSRVRRNGERGFRFNYSSMEGPEVVLYLVTSSSHGGVFEFHTDIVNGGEVPFRIVPGEFASFELPRNENLELFAVHKESGAAEGYMNFTGYTYEGTGIYSFPLAPADSLDIELETTLYQSWNENGYIPLVFVHSPTEGIFAGYEWTSGRIGVSCVPGENPVRVSIDMDEISSEGGPFSTLVPAGETVSLPRVYLGAYEGSLDDGSNAFKHWYFACKVPAGMREDECEPYTQEDMQRGLDSYGVEIVKWDYGWWSDDRIGPLWESYEGSWKVRDSSMMAVLDSYGCRTISDFTAEAHKRGIRLTTYALLHDTRGADGEVTDSEGEFNSVTHPEWFSNRHVDSCMGRSADLGNTECVRFLIDTLGNFLKSNGISTWRSDFEPICFYSDKANRHDPSGTDVQYWATVGFRELVSGIRADYPALRYESCSSGGSMKDLFTATLANVLNCDDASGYLELRMTFYGSSYIFPPSQLLMPSNADFHNTYLPDKMWPKVDGGEMDRADFHRAMMDMGYRSICIAVPMFSTWTGTIEPEYYEKYSEMYKNRIRPLVRAADLYHILPRPDGIHFDGIEYFDPAVGKGAIFLFKPSEAAGDEVTLDVRGLDPSGSYRFEFEDRPSQSVTLPAAAVAESGLKVVIDDPVGSEIIWISSED